MTSPHILNTPLREHKPITTPVSSLGNGDTTPSVKDGKMFTSPSGATTVTDFDDAGEGQEITILGNGNLTVSNNANIKTNTGANKVLAANKVYKFTHWNDGVWYEDE